MSITSSRSSARWPAIASAIRARIADGTYPVGDHLPSITDQATELGTTPTVIKQARASLMSEGLIQRRGTQPPVVIAAHSPRADRAQLRTRLLEAAAALRREADALEQLANEPSAGDVFAAEPGGGARAAEPAPGPESDPVSLVVEALGARAPDPEIDAAGPRVVAVARRRNRYVTIIRAAAGFELELARIPRGKESLRVDSAQAYPPGEVERAIRDARRYLTP